MLSYNLIKDVSITWGDDFVKIAGPKGVLLKRKSDFCLAVKDSKLFVWSSEYPHKENAYLSWLHQLIIGVTKGYTKKLRLIGVGFRATVTDNTLKLKLGFSHEVAYTFPKEITIIPAKSKGTILLIKGAELTQVNQVAADIRGLRKPDAYKGKGIHYYNEVLKLKKGKREGK
jgi:large subunit ribosomal protein L6